MKKLFKSLKNKAGYISIETVIVAGLMIALGAFAITQFYGVGQELTYNALDKVSEVMNVQVQQQPIDLIP